jgi:hypothetical protein
MEIVRLNASALSDSDSFLIPISAPPILTKLWSTMLDCGSLHSFVDPHWAAHCRLPLLPTPLKKLVLIDGTSNAIITQEICVPLRFACGKVTLFMFFVTPLSTSCPMILGMNWLTLHNLLVDWALRQISFRPLALDGVAPLTSPLAATPTQESLPPPTLTSPTAPHTAHSHEFYSHRNL